MLEFFEFLFKDWLHEFCSGCKQRKQRHGREFVSALNTIGDAVDEFRKGDFNDVGNIVISGKDGMNSRRISRGGDYCDSNVPLAKKTSQVKKRDGVAFCHKREYNKMWGGNGHHFCLLFSFSCS